MPKKYHDFEVFDKIWAIRTEWEKTYWIWKWVTHRQSIFDFNFLQNDKILDQFKLKAIADDTVNMTKKLKFILAGVENINGLPGDKILNWSKFKQIADDNLNFI